MNRFTNIAWSYYGTLGVTNTVTAALPAVVALKLDANGNLTNDGVKVFGYDAENQLTTVTVAGQWREDFGYDGLNRRRITRQYRWDAGTTGWALTNEVRFIYDGNVVMQEWDSNNVATVSYTRGSDLSGSRQGAGGIGGLLARQSTLNAQPATVYYHADGSGNITALMDGSQYVVGRYLYDPFGRLLGKWGAQAEANVYRFSSKEWDGNAGVYYYGYRFYEPNLQRWVNRDPIQERGGVNLYGFVGNNPVTACDYFGLSTPECINLLADLAKNALSLTKELAKYDPVADAKGGYPMKYGTGLTKPGGHYNEMMDLKRGLYKDLMRYYKNCVKCDKDGGGGDPAPPKKYEDLINLPIPVPVYSSQNGWLAYFPGSDAFWDNANTAAWGVVAFGAGGAFIAGTGGTVLIFAPAAL